MKNLENIYDNKLGSTYKIYSHPEDRKLLAIEINSVSFLINHQELKNFITSIDSIIDYHKNCTCAKDLENKMVIYQAAQTEIRMRLSFDQLLQLRDLIKGTDFKLGMHKVLEKYKIS